MPIEYINRRKEKYYIKATLSKTGKMVYSSVKDKPKLNLDELLQEIPQGFEFYESPCEARVYFRKVPIYNITDAEVEIVNSAMKMQEIDSAYIVEKGVDRITVYIGQKMSHNFDAEFSLFKEKLYLFQSYDEQLRFEKIRKTYEAQRFCYRSSHNDWITMENSKDLKYLAEKYCYHIDKDSLFDFGCGL